jgi:phosphatidylserine/phosphatidylglycerophosphate/cardiolipin synthase-like enzyme
MVIDNQSVITGSFNFTAAAQEHNAENVLVLKGVPELASVYAKDWEWRQTKSRVYHGGS